MQTIGRRVRALLRWMRSATSSLPVPVSPVMRTLLSLSAARAIDRRTWPVAALAPTRAAPSTSGVGDSASAVAPVTRLTLAAMSDEDAVQARTSLTPARSASMTKSWSEASEKSSTAQPRSRARTARASATPARLNPVTGASARRSQAPRSTDASTLAESSAPDTCQPSARSAVQNPPPWGLAVHGKTTARPYIWMSRVRRRTSARRDQRVSSANQTHGFVIAVDRSARLKPRAPDVGAVRVGACEASGSEREALAERLSADVAGGLVLAQPDEPRVPEVVLAAPFEELELPDELRLQPAAGGHLLFRQPLTPPAARAFGQVDEGAVGDLERLELLEDLLAQRGREAVAGARGVDQAIPVVVADDERVEGLPA